MIAVTIYGCGAIVTAAFIGLFVKDPDASELITVSLTWPIMLAAFVGQLVQSFVRGAALSARNRRQRSASK